MQSSSRRRGAASALLLLAAAVQVLPTAGFMTTVPTALSALRPPRHAAVRMRSALRSRRGRSASLGGALASRCEAWRGDEDVVIVGAGMAGMACALELKERGIPFTVVEAAQEPGGRVRTDEVDGFLLDHGFQIFLTSYPEAQRLLDYKQLDLQPFYAGADVRFAGAFHRVADPFRAPVDALLSLLPSHPIGSVYDKILIGVLRLQSLVGSIDELYARPDVSIGERLSKDVLFGTAFSPEMVDRFFRPFLGGIFFDNKLRTNAHELDFVFRMLALGENCLPKKGIRAVSDYMASLLPPGSLRLSTPVASIAKDGSSVKLSNGETLKAAAVVVATDGSSARRLLSGVADLGPEAEVKQTTCLYFAIDGDAPSQEPILYLNGDGVEDAEGTTKVNNMCFPSTVSASYAPAGQSLASVSLIGIPAQTDEEVAADVKKQLAEWFGPSVNEWRLLRTYRIPYCQPNQETPSSREKAVECAPYVYVAGDHRETASLQGALRSGTRCGQAVSAALSPMLLQRSRGVVEEFAKSKGIDIAVPAFEPEKTEA